MKGLLVVATMAVCLRGQAQIPAAALGDASPLARQIEAMVAEPAVARAHWGVMVTAMDGTPIYALNEGQLFQPASNAKLFTTAAALALIGPERKFETRIVASQAMSEQGVLSGDLLLVGGGDANLSGREFPYSADPHAPRPQATQDPLRYLAELADGAVASGLKAVEGDVVGDDSFFPYEPYPIDWAIDDAVWGYGAPISALSVADNQLRLTVKPGAGPRKTATVQIDQAIPYYDLDDALVATGPSSSPTRLQIERQPESRVIRVFGEIAANAPPDVEEIAIAGPAEYAAMALKHLLEERGVRITGKARAFHAPVVGPREFLDQVQEPIDPKLFGGQSGIGCADFGRPDLLAHEVVIAAHSSPSLGEDVVMTNKVSQNLHAEMLLHHLGKKMTCVGSTAQGARVVRSFAVNADIDAEDLVLYDGSGLSGHDLVTPRAIAKLLQFASTQPWFGDYKASLPVGGVDGSLQSRFTKTPLKGHVFAKTGTLGEARALSGYLECASGRTVVFSVMVGNHAPGTSADREVMDRIVGAIAAAN